MSRPVIQVNRKPLSFLEWELLVACVQQAANLRQICDDGHPDMPIGENLLNRIQRCPPERLRELQIFVSDG